MIAGHAGAGRKPPFCRAIATEPRRGAFHDAPRAHADARSFRVNIDHPSFQRSTMTTVKMTVNGQAVTRDVENRQLLVEVLRDGLGLTGTHQGCDTSQCGCCTVLVDGRAVKSCTMLAVQAEGCSVTTIEGLGSAQALHPIQQAFIDCHGLQCGFCTPGMIMTTAALLAETPEPDDDTIREALDGNLCRCTGYTNIVEAVRQASATMAGKSVARPR